MITIHTRTSNGSQKHLIAVEAIASITETGASLQWHGIRSYVRLFDGTKLEAEETLCEIEAAIKADNAANKT
jgi:hypothetical protein